MGYHKLFGFANAECKAGATWDYDAGRCETKVAIEEPESFPKCQDRMSAFECTYAQTEGGKCDWKFNMAQPDGIPMTASCAAVG